MFPEGFFKLDGRKMILFDLWVVALIVRLYTTGSIPLTGFVQSELSMFISAVMIGLVVLYPLNCWIVYMFDKGRSHRF